MENQESRAQIIPGVDTHLDIHVGAVIDTAGCTGHPVGEHP